MKTMRRSGIDVIGDVPWGTHFCQFYESSGDLIETLVPYFREGLAANEFCMWVTSEPLQAEEARSSLAQAVPDLDGQIEAGRIEILDYTMWYTRSGRFDADEVLQGWGDKLKSALDHGFAGLRLTGNTFWLEPSCWDDFARYEARVNDFLGRYPILALCTYFLPMCKAADIMDVVANHEFALVKRRGRWEIIESSHHAKMDRALRESEQRLRQAMSVGRSFAFEWDPSTDEITRSEECGEILGLEGELAVTEKGRTFFEKVHFEDRERFLSVIGSLSPSRNTYTTSYRINRPDGGTAILEETARGSFDGMGRLTRLVGMAADVTARELAQQELLRAHVELEKRVAERTAQLSETVRTLQREVKQRTLLEGQLRTLARNLPSIVYRVHLKENMRMEFFNDMFQALTGYDPERLSPGSVCSIDPLIDPRDRNNVIQKVREAVQAGAPFVIEYRVNTRDGEVRHFLERGRPVREEDGSPLYIDGVIMDVTERVQAEEKLRTMNAALESRTVQLRALASELTLAEQRERHRLAQILHDHLQQLLVGAKLRVMPLQRAGEQGVRQAALEIGDLIDDSLEATRTLTGELSPPILHEGGLIPALEWLVRWMHEKHEIQIDLAADERAVPYREDVKVLLFQAARELLFNVVKHAGVKAARLRVTAENGRIRMTVADEGAGFDPALLAAPGAGKGGFGLFSLRERLDLIGGRFEVDSSPGGGSRFLLEAPAGRAQPPGTPVQGREDALLPEAAASGTKARIGVLLVDDHVVMRQGLAHLLKEEPDIEIVGEAADGEAAISLSRERRPDIVLMDISMPIMSGIEATRIIHDELPDIQVIGLSMFSDQERAAEMLRAGAVSYLTKSGPPADLVIAIRNCAGRIDRSNKARVK